MNPFSKNVLALVEDIEQRFLKADLFYGHGTDNALDEAVFIVFTVLNLEFDCPQEELEQEVNEGELKIIEDIIEERITTRKPAAYLLNKAWFCGLPFYVNEQVLVPRSPIAELIEERFSPWIDTAKVKRILDIGTGSGCIAIAAAYAFPDAKVDAIDIDEQALQVTRKNIQAHGLEQRVTAIQSDLFENINQEIYDLIISNPPYVSDDEVAELPDEYQHEPKHGLRADDNGLALVHTILKESANYINDDGLLITEVGFSEEALIQAYPKAPFFWFEFERGGQGVFMLTKEQLQNIFK